MKREEILESLKINDETLNKIKDYITNLNNNNHWFIIVDCETLGIDRDSVVLSLGAYIFNIDVRNDDLTTLNPQGGNISRYFYMKFNIPEQIEKDRIIDSSTMKFWFGENYDTLIKELTDGEKHSIQDISMFIDWINYWIKTTNEKVKIIYRGMDFDDPLLKSLIKSAGIEEDPWLTPRIVRDVRTFIDGMLDIRKGSVPEIKREGVHHNALDDCLHDARQIQIAYAIKNKII